MQAIIDRIFDEIIVVSLVQSTDRRMHIEKHFSEIGIRSYRFFDATHATDPAVEAAFADGIVMRYPPCFRCGKDACDKLGSGLTDHSQKSTVAASASAEK